ncbi:MAG: Major Facilitator Superfamily protein [Alphaproteobacteria bacterium ADurb.Bin438]|nr:MAG: Major Facilitator Superfamily protein [Alphaproteobacteria bacterium ADurb.Bin438]
MQCWFASTAAVVANSLGDGGVMWYGSESAMPWAIFTILLTIPIGFSTVCTTVGINTLMQTVCDDDKRSRIISFYTICLNGVSALGMLACGFLADKFGTIQTTILFGVMTVVAAMVYLFNAPKVSKSLRPVFDMIEQES